MRFRPEFGLALVMGLWACKDDSVGPQVRDISQLAGTWVVEVWEYSREGNSAQKVDWVARWGLSGSLGIERTGQFTVNPKLPGGIGVDEGTLKVSGDSIYWDGEDDEEWVRYAVTGNGLTVFWPETEFTDMDRDGRPEDAWLRVVFRRR